MSRPRFSIGSLMVVVLFCGVGAAALRSSSGLWAQVLFTLTLAMLGVAALGALYRRGARRASWAGFVLFGGGYLALCFGPWAAGEVRPHLATSALLSYARERIVPADPNANKVAVFVDGNSTWSANTQPTGWQTGVTVSSSNVVLSGGQAKGQIVARAPSTILFTKLLGAGGAEHFERIGHCLLALLLGVVGGLVARRFHAAGAAEVAT